MASGYPVVLSLANRLCVVAGGGSVAERKAAGLLEAGANVHVIAPRLTPRLKEWGAAGKLRATERAIEADDLEGAALLFAATDRPDVNRSIAEEARARGIPVNLADQGEAGDFVTPAVVRRGRLVFAVSASGAGPAFAARLAAELSERYGEEYESLAEQLYKLRRAALSSVSDPAERRKLLQASASDAALELWKKCPEDSAGEVLLSKLKELARDRHDQDLS
ncbi:precorrin-2 dehydrogenase/sirohydrochlorin ferrochelatase family protein [Cohnella thailandensis]|uniref:precorrin-2 dehydrogenase n=1 Tax=Cohnella thailandensis TaxID=557557 RepID=A0A841SN56_9BACL|nr:bifunctional precorrin-2 dehydrogenase/sirohydrochlorin ferrochelatase [Cohnella thailandensis]MBB6633893.1 bifunctional precorrin-2 dehydrogenase/sirohydrochlorin ferrochelatase [Cohnella thailandensis]MBP1972576.1 precorrin-2 dehydrogenase/sirohydrochlorin ferrochelatase [Cohnella thailandensis]